MAKCKKHEPGGDNHVLDSRPREQHIWRRRVCNKCKEVFTTIEITRERLSELEDIERGQVDLDTKLWAVIDADGVQHSGLTYRQAEPLAKSSGAGAIIVSIATAAALKKKGGEDDNDSAVRQEPEADGQK